MRGWRGWRAASLTDKLTQTLDVKAFTGYQRSVAGIRRTTTCQSCTHTPRLLKRCPHVLCFFLALLSDLSPFPAYVHTTKSVVVRTPRVRRLLSIVNLSTVSPTTKGLDRQKTQITLRKACLHTHIPRAKKEARKPSQLLSCRPPFFSVNGLFLQPLDTPAQQRTPVRRYSQHNTTFTCHGQPKKPADIVIDNTTKQVASLRCCSKSPHASGMRLTYPTIESRSPMSCPNRS